MKIPYTMTSNAISFFWKGKPFLIDKTHINYEAVVNAVLASADNLLEALVTVKAFIVKATNGKVKIGDEEVFYGATKVPEYLATKILEFMKNGQPVEALCRFTEKLLENPNKEILDDLYKWLEKGNMPLYEDGDFLAYKVVNGNYTAIHDANMKQVVGSTVSMPREKCDSNRHNTCSTGLHFCSYEYLPSFQGFDPKNRVIVLKINPMNVTAIPTDYNLTKGRCCEFTVIDEIDATHIQEHFGGTWVVAAKDSQVGKVVPKEKKENRETNLLLGKWTKSDVAKKLKNSTKTAAAEFFGVARSTLSRWMKKNGMK